MTILVKRILARDVHAARVRLATAWDRQFREYEHGTAEGYAAATAEAEAARAALVKLVEPSEWVRRLDWGPQAPST